MAALPKVEVIRCAFLWLFFVPSIVCTSTKYLINRGWLYKTQATLRVSVRSRGNRHWMLNKQTSLYMQAVVQISNPCSKLAFFLSSLKSCHCRVTSRKLMSGRLSCTEKCEMGLIPHFSRCLTWATTFSDDKSIPFKMIFSQRGWKVRVSGSSW